MSSQQIPGYKRHSLDEFTPEIKRQRTNQKLPNGDVKKTRGRVKINIEVCYQPTSTRGRLLARIT